MHISVLDIINFVCISMMSKSTESSSIQVNCQRLLGYYKHVNTHIKLFTTNQKRVHNVSLDDIWLSLRTFRFPSKVILPLGNLSQFIEQENASALRLTNRFHNPNSLNTFKFLNEQGVVTWQIVRSWKEPICSGVLRSAFFLLLLLVPFEILDHQIFSGQLKMISIMVNSLMWLQMEMIKYFIDGISLDP